MNKYEKANQIRKKRIIDLIAENKFEEGKSLSSSIGSAVSDKFKAKATGIKEKLDPLNIVRALTGSGVVGKSIRTVAGRALGRSESDIRYFGGYGRKNKKDPRRTTISSGNNNPLKIGDSVADILAKMYIFMEKVDALEKKQEEIMKSFREEDKEEEERRHEKLMKEIVDSTKKATAEPEKAKDEDSGFMSFIKQIVDGIGTLIAPIWKVLKTVGAIASKAFTFVKDTISNMFGILKPLFDIGGSLVGLIGGLVTGALIPEIFAAMSPLMMGLIAGYVGKVLLERFKSKQEDTTKGTKLVNSLRTNKIIAGTESQLFNQIKDEDETKQKEGPWGVALREVPIPGTNESVALPMNEDDVNEFAKGYSDYLDSLQKYKNIQKITTAPFGEAYNKKQADLEEANSEIISKRMALLGLEYKYSKRFKEDSKIAKHIEGQINLIKKELGIPTGIIGKATELFREAKSYTGLATNMIKSGVEEFNTGLENFKQTESGKEMMKAIDNWPEYYKEIQKGIDTGLDSLFQVTDDFGGNLTYNEVKNIGGKAQSYIDNNPISARDINIQHTLGGIISIF
jgi:hypothetical protein